MSEDDDDNVLHKVQYPHHTLSSLSSSSSKRKRLHARDIDFLQTVNNSLTKFCYANSSPIFELFSNL